MKARLPKGYGRPDPNAMMRQVQKMQDEIRAKQEELEAKEYTGTASGEMVTVTMTGKHEITAVKIKPEAVDPEDIEMLEDLIAAAVNSAVAAVDKESEEEMAQDDRRAEHSRSGLRGRIYAAEFRAAGKSGGSVCPVSRHRPQRRHPHGLRGHGHV